MANNWLGINLSVKLSQDEMQHQIHQFTSDWGHDLAHFRELGDILGKRWGI